MIFSAVLFGASLGVSIAIGDGTMRAVAQAAAIFAVAFVGLMGVILGPDDKALAARVDYLASHLPAVKAAWLERKKRLAAERRRRKRERTEEKQEPGPSPAAAARLDEAAPDRLLSDVAGPRSPADQWAIIAREPRLRPRAEPRANRPPHAVRPGESTVQCYDCRYQFPVSETVAQTVKVGHSEGGFFGFGSGGGWAAGSTSAAHYAKVDLCLRCAELRRKRALLEALQICCILLAILIGAVVGVWAESFVAALIAFFSLTIGGLAVVQVCMGRLES
jgi:hypothetical protein